MTSTPIDHPLGDTTSVVSDGLGETLREVGPESDAKSIVDTILDLDAFLSGEVRLAVRQAAFFTRPDLEATIEALNAELDSLTDSQGRPLPVVDQAVADGERSALVVAQELYAVQKEYAASRRVILMRQLDEDDWAAFTQQWKDALAKEPPYPASFYEDLIVKSASKPALTADEVRQLRKKLGRPAYDELFRAAWLVNTQSGVSIPKSSLSSAVLRQQQQG